jgi:hypothetical protein
MGVVLPSHDYDYKGEGVIGRDLREVNLGVAAGYLLGGRLAGTVAQGAYTYSFVERVLDIRNDRSNAAFDLGYRASPKVYLHGFVSWQRTHGGLRFGPPGMANDVCPCDPVNPEQTPKFDEHDRLLRDNYWHAGGGMAYSFEGVDVFASVRLFLSGTNTHAGQAYTLGMTYYFGAGSR